MKSKFSDMTSSSNFLTLRISFVKFSYWPQFHVKIITGSRVKIIFYKGLTRNQKIGNTTVWVLPVWRLGRVMDVKLGTNISDKMLLNAAKCQGFSFYQFWVDKGKPTGGGGEGIISHPDKGYEPGVHTFTNFWRKSS